MLLRPGKVPSGREVRAVLYRLVKRIRTHWPKTVITIRGDSHYGRPEVMEWCEKNRVRYVFAVAGNDVLHTLAEPAANVVAAEFMRKQKRKKPIDKVRAFDDFRYAAKSWTRPRRVIARIEASRNGLDVRYVATNIHRLGPERLYAGLYCQRGQAENLIKLHKGQLKSDRTSCHAALANQMRLILHTGAYWLLLTLRNAIPKSHALAKAEFATLQLQLIKIGARISETAARVRIAFAAACPQATLIKSIAAKLAPDSS
jgi:hypothetical protein